MDGCGLWDSTAFSCPRRPISLTSERLARGSVGRLIAVRSPRPVVSNSNQITDSCIAPIRRDLHIDNVGAMNLQQLRSQSASSRYQFSRLISPHPDDSNTVRSPTRGGHQSHSPLGGHNAGRFNAFSQPREESGQRDNDGRWDAHKSLDLGRRDFGGSLGSGSGQRESSGGLSSSLPSNSSSRWVKTEGDEHSDWRSRKGSPKKAWQDGSHGSHGHGHHGGGHDNGGGSPVWADVSVDPSQRIEMHVADVIEQERQKMKEMWKKQAEEKRHAAAAAALQEEVGDDEIEMWKVRWFDCAGVMPQDAHTPDLLA